MSICSKTGLREEFSKVKFKEMRQEVKKSYGPQGTFEINNLHDFYGNNDVIRSPEWMRVVTTMTKSKKGHVDKFGYSFEELSSALFDKIKRLMISKPEMVPDYAISSHENLCYFVLAIAEFRGKSPQPCVHISSYV